MNEIVPLTNDKKYDGIYVFGDLNLDLLKHNDSSVFEFINLMYSFSLFPLITRPTRITDASATLIDHIWVSQLESNISNHIIHTDITDHFPVVSQFKFHNSIKRNPVYINKRVITQTALENLSKDLSQVNWTDVLESNCPNESYDIFFP